MQFRASSLASLPPPELEAFLKSLNEDELTALEYDWRFWARDNQLAPSGLWRIWLLLSGRGYGKTRVGAEWVIEKAKGDPKRIALIAATFDDVRGTMIEGESGIVARSPPWFMPTWEPSVGRGGTLTWLNGSQAFGYSGEVPRGLRGPQHHAGWLDELAAWTRMQETWDMYRFGLRLGSDPQTVITTTPTPAKLIKDLVADKRIALDGSPLVRITRGSMYENAANLADEYLADLKAKYDGTRLGRQELYGEILLDKPGALWTYKRIEDTRVTSAPELQRIVVAIDPPAKSTEGSDECGIVVAGVTGSGRTSHGYVLADISERGLSPREWAEKALGAFYEWQADALVAEVNQGGEMVEEVIRGVDPQAPLRTVHASRGKYIRAEPVSALYQQGRVHHAGVFKVLEDQMCEFVPDWDRSKHGSPDRLDAMVWGITELMLGGVEHQPRIRRL